MEKKLNAINNHIKNSFNLRENNFYKNNQNIYIVKPPIYKFLIKFKNKLIKRNVISNPIKKKGHYNFIKKRNLDNKNFDKIKLEEKTTEKFIKHIEHFNSFKNLSEDQIYELYIKLYSKTDNELNDLPYQLALKYDKRTYFAFYFSLLKCNHLIFFSFLPKFDFNSKIIKIYLFFFNIATYFFINALFFTDETISYGFNFINNLPQIIYSSIISTVINEIIKLLALTEINFINYRNKAKKENVLILSFNLKRNFKIKFIIFFILDMIILGFCWIYLSCFSAVYSNTQMHLIKDTFISFGTSLVSPMVLYLLPGIFRIPSLKYKNRRILFFINQLLQLL